ncbi:MAG: Gfo/Idh/MocA family oxidoreductase, partial [Pedobacter sp.]|nr:Gfo/Idh/MocA family oxidoreductase [Pedobacter sp.]
MIDRRKFVTSGALTLSGLALFGTPVLGALSPNDTIQVGLIGTGARGAGLASLIKDIPQLKLVACCDLIPENLAKGMSYADKNAKSYSDYNKLLEDKNVDAVIVATPLYLHYPMTIAALSAGKHVYTEKTMTYSIEQSLDLVKRMKHSDLVLQVGFQYRYYDLYHLVKEIMKENWLGKISHFECQYNRNSNWRFPVRNPAQERLVNWRMYREYCGGPLSELCAHEIDAVNMLLDSHPLKVTGMGSIDYWKDGRDTYDNIRTIYQYPNGIKASFTSVLSNAYNGYSIRILGDKATVEILRNKAFIYPETINNAKGTVDGVTGATKAVT